MKVPARWSIALSAVVVALVALVANYVVARIESPSAGLGAEHGPSLPAPAQPASPGFEHTASFDVETQVARSGRVTVQETITQDFGVVPRHGIERTIPQNDDVGDHPISHLVVSTSEGTPDDVSVSASSNVRIRIGDPDTTITGVHVYRLTYEIGGVIRDAGGQPGLALDAIYDWHQTIDSLRYHVVGPVPPTSVACQQGSVGSKAPCASTTRDVDAVTFTGTQVFPGTAFTVRLRWPDDAVAITASTRTIDAADVGYALLAGLMVAYLGWRYRARWRKLLATAQTQLWTTFGPDAGTPQTQGYSITDEPAIEFVPPMDLRPGELGALVEAGNTRILTATVVDLAARGAMRITETKGSWTLDRTGAHVALTDDEQVVMSELFGSGTTTSLDGRRTEMGTLAGQYAELVTDDLEARGLAAPGTRAGGLKTHASRWGLLVVGLIAVAAGTLLQAIAVGTGAGRGIALVAQTVTVLLLMFAMGMLIVFGAAKGSTPLGLAAAWRARGFDRFFTESEAMHDRAAADQGLLRQYMGYAIVYGHVSQWIAAFQAQDTSDWFATTSSIDHAFAGFTASSNWTAPSSSGSGGGSGGGAGGGSGGGGGGSW